MRFERSSRLLSSSLAFESRNLDLIELLSEILKNPFFGPSGPGPKGSILDPFLDPSLVDLGPQRRDLGLFQNFFKYTYKEQRALLCGQISALKTEV